MVLVIQSTAFKRGERIPAQHTREGSDISPPLSWTGAPENTKSFALICDDPDAPGGTWVHWVMWNIPASTTSLPPNIPKIAKLPDGSQQGMTDFGREGYGGPCPPPGKPHRYFFKLYALDITNLEVPGRGTKADLEPKMSRHILAQADIFGVYQR